VGVSKLFRVPAVPVIKACSSLHVIPKQADSASAKVICKADSLVTAVATREYSAWPLAQSVVVDALDISQAEWAKFTSGVSILSPSFCYVSLPCGVPVGFPPLVIASIKDVCEINQLKATVYDN